MWRLLGGVIMVKINDLQHLRFLVALRCVNYQPDCNGNDKYDINAYDNGDIDDFVDNMGNYVQTMQFLSSLNPNDFLTGYFDNHFFTDDFVAFGVKINTTIVFYTIDDYGNICMIDKSQFDDTVKLWGGL